MASGRVGGGESTDWCFEERRDEPLLLPVVVLARAKNEADMCPAIVLPQTIHGGCR